MIRRHWLVAAVALTLVVSLAGCWHGDSRKVDSCADCYGSEHCVYGLDGLYCANGCVSQLSCTVDHWCVPLVDEEYLDEIVWVCMPDEYYTDDGLVYRSDCGEYDGEDCPTGMTCLEDTVDYGDYYCADECYHHSDCLTDCCVPSTDGYDYCAPFYPFCG